MKKAISIALCLCLFFMCAAPCVSALSIDAGTEALNGCFTDGVSPEGMDYVAFSPLKGESDGTKYPLFIWLHGMRSGIQPRAQLNNYEFSNWASDEYQARFENAGGCFLLAPRAGDKFSNSWEADMCVSLKKTVDYYISLYPDNIDSDRIYIGGYSSGGSMVWDMISQYPDYFAAAIPAAAIYPPTNSSLNKLGKTAVWVLCCDKDPYPLSETADVKPCFDYLAKLSNKPSQLRLTTFSEAVFADGSILTSVSNGVSVPAEYAQHYIWEAVTYDMFMADRKTPYLYAATIDGNGNTLELNDYGDGIIKWLSSQSRNSDEPDKQLSFFERLMMAIRRIIDFFKSLFS